MPFVLHQTEMVQEQNKQHMARMMESREFEFQTAKDISRRYFNWNAEENIRHISLNPPPQNRSEAQFKVFNGVTNLIIEPEYLSHYLNERSDEVIARAEIIQSIRKRPDSFKGFRRVKHRTIIVEEQLYRSRSTSRLSANLGWNYWTPNYPGKSCEITLNAPNFTRENFTTAFIEKDSDWIEDDESWTQCVRDGEDEFEFSVQYKSDTLAIYVIRNDFLEPNICKYRLNDG